MLQMLTAVLLVQGLHVAAALGIADQLAGGARGVDDLANATGADPASLYRLLRMLAAAGVFCEEADGRFALTALQPRARLFELASRDLQIGHARNLESIETLRVLEHCGVAARANVVADRRDRALYFPVQCRVECNELRKQLAETGLYGRQTCDLRHASPRLS